jgi:hypothetical protein
MLSRLDLMGYTEESTGQYLRRDTAGTELSPQRSRRSRGGFDRTCNIRAGMSFFLVAGDGNGGGIGGLTDGSPFRAGGGGSINDGSPSSTPDAGGGSAWPLPSAGGGGGGGGGEGTITGAGVAPNTATATNGIDGGGEDDGENGTGDQNGNRGGNTNGSSGDTVYGPLDPTIIPSVGE